MDKKLVILMTVFVLSFSLFVTTVFLSKKDINGKLTKAAGSIPSAKNSLIFAYPLLTTADGKSQVKVMVYVRNDRDKDPEPISFKKVKVSSTLGKFTTDEVASDKNGQAIFYLSSTTPGIAQIKAVVDNTVALERQITAQFK